MKPNTLLQLIILYPYRINLQLFVLVKTPSVTHKSIKSFTTRFSEVKYRQTRIRTGNAWCFTTQTFLFRIQDSGIS